MLVCNITNVFTVTFDQFNVAFLNKSINNKIKNKKKYIYIDHKPSLCSLSELTNLYIYKVEF